MATVNKLPLCTALLVLALVAVSVSALVGWKSARPTWEYKYVDTTNISIERDLRAAGDKGWELAGTTVLKGIPGLIFKRSRD